MSLRNRITTILTLCVCLAMNSDASPARADLQKYVERAEPHFGWKLNGKTDSDQAGRIYDLRFVSQTWQDNPWQHQLQIYQPAKVAPNAKMFLWLTGGGSRPEYVWLGMELARKIKAPVAFLYNIPNQPLLDGLREDDLIAETFVRYLKTQDENWPLLLPMVKSVVKAMDVLQEFGKKEWNVPIEKFIVAGASKRGWTTWLAAAVDQRVGAIAPVVIDTLNMREQMPRQLEAFGAYSSQLAPYSGRGLLPIPETPEGRRLLSLVDPWAYREKLAMPKLIINGTNDLYWATDALNLYWDGIPADKWVLYIPNAGHNLRRRDRPQAEQLNDLIDGLAGFARHQMSGAPMPKVSWKHETGNGKVRLTIAATPAPIGARLWIARTPAKDFRAATWNEQAVSLSDGKITGEVTLPDEGHLAVFGELDYEIDGLRYRLSTQMRTTE